MKKKNRKQPNQRNKANSDDSGSSPSEKGRKCSNPENICMPEEIINQKNRSFDAKNFFESYWYALSGIKLIIQNERNFRIQLVTTILVIFLGLFFNVNHDDWAILALVTALVLVAESFNSVIEAVCDTISQEYRINIRYAKNVSAGAVLVSAGVSLIAGVVIFAPYVLDFLTENFEILSFLEF